MTTIKVLVVDDSATIRRVLVKEISQSGYHMLEAEDAQSAMALLKTDPQIGLVTLDVEMNACTGFELLEDIRRIQATNEATGAIANRNLPILFVTSRDTAEDRAKGFALGAADFIVKPFPQGELRFIVDRMLRPGGELKGLNAIVVDDQQASRQIVSSCLTQLGTTVHLAKSAAGATELIQKLHRDLDLLVTSMNPAGGSAISLTQLLRKDFGRRDLPVLVLTDNDDETTAISLFKAGVTDYITKPFIKENLESLLRVHLERQRLNRLLRQNIDELKELNSLKDTYLSVCSHDMRAPLTAILGVCDLFKTTELGDEDKKSLMGIVESSGENLLELINHISLSAKGRAAIQPDDIVVQDVTPILSDCLDTLAFSARKKGVELSMENTGKPVQIMGIRTSLTRIFNNLLTNAIKFTRRGGKVKITILPTANGTVRIAFEDNGIGIAHDQFPVLFNRYTPASRAGTDGEPGTGLGLFIIKDLVEAHQGTITVDSDPGQGSTFTIELPRAS
jgi:signal transduction histidine kinase